MTEAAAPKPGVLATLRRYAILAYGAFGTMLDVGLMVLGSLLIGLAISVLVVGFGLAEKEQDLSTGAMLITAIVLAVTGLFCLGVASEGPLGRGRRLLGFKVWEVGIGRALAVIAVGFGAVLLQGLLVELLDGLPEPLRRGTDGLRAVGVAGVTAVPLIGVPLSLLARAVPDRYRWVRILDVPVMFLVWGISTMIVLG